MSQSLLEVSRATGIHVSVLKKHVQRGKLRTTKEDGRIMVADEDMVAYLESEDLLRAAKRSRGQPIEVVESELAELLRRFPPRYAVER